MDDSVHVQVEVVKLDPIGVWLADIHRDFDAIDLSFLKHGAMTTIGEKRL